MLPSFATDTVVRIRPGSTARRGSTEPDWSTATELTINGCSIQPASTSLSQDGRVLGISDGMTAYFPPGSDVQAGDRIRIGTDVYQVNGDPREWKSPTGRVSNIQVALVRWCG